MSDCRGACRVRSEASRVGLRGVEAMAALKQAMGYRRRATDGPGQAAARRKPNTAAHPLERNKSRRIPAS